LRPADAFVVCIRRQADVGTLLSVKALLREHGERDAFERGAAFGRLLCPSSEPFRSSNAMLGDWYLSPCYFAANVVVASRFLLPVGPIRLNGAFPRIWPDSNNNPKPAWVRAIALLEVGRQSSLAGSSRQLGVFKPWLLNVPKAKNLLEAKNQKLIIVNFRLLAYGNSWA
jgi:hypothetical protein